MSEESGTLVGARNELKANDFMLVFFTTSIDRQGSMRSLSVRDDARAGVSLGLAFVCCCLRCCEDGETNRLLVCSVPGYKSV